MPYPVEQRLKNLEEQVRQLSTENRRAHPVEDAIFHGIVVTVSTDPINCDSVYIRVAPYPPDSLSDAGDIWFDSTVFHPLQEVGAVTAEKPIHYDKVYCINAPEQLWALYFKVGDRITYWRYSGTGPQSEKIRGTYVTMLPDTSFYARISLQQPPDPDADPPDPEEGCTNYPTFTLSKGQFAYDFTAVAPDPSKVQMKDSWPDYVCGATYKVTGTAYNVRDVKQPGCGVVAAQVVKVTPILIRDYKACTDQMWTYWFDEAPDERWLQIYAVGTRPGTYKCHSFYPLVNFDLGGTTVVASTSVGAAGTDEIRAINTMELNKSVSDASTFDLAVGTIWRGVYMGPDLQVPYHPTYWITGIGVAACGS